MLRSFLIFLIHWFFKEKYDQRKTSNRETLFDFSKDIRDWKQLKNKRISCAFLKVL